MNTIYYEEPVAVSLRELAEYCGCKFIGDGCTQICGVNTLKQANRTQLSFLGNKKYMNDLRNTNACVVIINERNVDDLPEGVGAIISSNVMATYGRALEILYKTQEESEYISPSAKIGKDVRIGVNTIIKDFVCIEDGAVIGDNCFIDSFVRIGKNVVVGNDCRISSHVSLKCAILGSGVSIHAGAKIGEPGFGIVPDGHKMVRIKQLGRVIIGNNVRIGANTTIDRGSVEDTVIGDETIIDNLVQIGHNVEVGKMVTLVAQVGIAGSTKIGDGAVLAGQVGVAGHISIGKGAVIAAKSGVASSVDDGCIMAGIPAVDAMSWRRQAAFLKKSVERK